MFCGVTVCGCVGCRAQQMIRQRRREKEETELEVKSINI